MAKKTKKQTLRLLPDVPFGERAEQSNDGLGFAQYAEILSRAALDTPEPFTIGVYGGWGSGKTSLMRMIQNEIKSEAIGVWFNAWRYEKEDHLIVPLLATIITEMDQYEKGIGANLKTGFKKLRDAFRGILYGVSIKGKIGIPGLSEAELSVSPKDMIDRYEKLSEMATERILDQSLYFRSFTKLDEIAQDETTPKIIIFVDDLDRCFPDKAVNLLENIKLVLNQPNITFILGISPNIIRAYLSAKYRKDYDLSQDLYVDYLDKLVQLPFPIPEIEETVEDYVRSLLKKEDVFGKIPDDKFKQEYEPLVSICGPACKDNPRAIIRFLNRLLILTRVHDQKKSRTKISLVHFGITNALQMNWPTIFNACEQDRQICIDSGSTNKENLCALLGLIFCNLKTETDQIERIECYAKDKNNPEQLFFQTLLIDESLRKMLSSKPGIEWLNKRALRKEAVVTTEQVKTNTTTTSKQTLSNYSQEKLILGKELAGTDLAEAYLVGADLIGANLEKAVLVGADLAGTHLERANLERADLERADLAGAYLERAHLERAVLEGANLERADLAGAHLHGAYLRGAYLGKANLVGAYLRGADLVRADLAGANLAGAELVGANIQGADLAGANIQDVSLEGARYNLRTKWPIDFDPISHGAILMP